VTYIGPPEDLQPGRYRLLIQEHEILRADGVPASTLRQRLVYAGTLPLDGLPIVTDPKEPADAPALALPVAQAAASLGLSENHFRREVPPRSGRSRSARCGSRP